MAITTKGLVLSNGTYSCQTGTRAKIKIVELQGAGNIVVSCGSAMTIAIPTLSKVGNLNNSNTTSYHWDTANNCVNALSGSPVSGGVSGAAITAHPIIGCGPFYLSAGGHTLNIGVGLTAMLNIIEET